MHIVHFIFPLAIYPSVYSSPVPPNAIKSKAELPLLTLFLTFVSLLFVLFCTKCLYIVRRRQAKKAGGSRVTLRSRWHDSFSTSSSRFGGFFMGSGDVKSGFLIGLLGSPSWETRYSGINVDHRSLLHQSSISSRKSVSEFSLASPTSKLCSSRPCHSSRVPVPEEPTPIANDTEPVTVPSPAVTINRSPLLSDSEYTHLLKGQPSSALPFRVISPMNSSSCNPCTKDTCRLCIPRASPPSSSVTNRGSIQISYSHHVGQDGSNPMANKPASLSGTKTPSPTSEPTNGISLDDSGAALRTQSSSIEQEIQKPLKSFSVTFPNVVQMFESTLTSISEHSSNSNLPQSMETTSKAPFVRSKTIHPTKHFLSLSYRRSRHSPKIGPSPLRTVIHPPDSCPDSFEAFSSNQYIPQRSSFGPARDFDPPEDLALGLEKDLQLLSAQTPGSKKSTDADSLLELMAQLAQETSGWDPKVFMDENFKKLITQSNPQVVLHEKMVRPRRHSWRSSRQRKVQHAFTTLEDIPEVDVTEMMPASTEDTVIHSFWADEDDDRQFLISNTR